MSADADYAEINYVDKQDKLHVLKAGDTMREGLA